MASILVFVALFVFRIHGVSNFYKQRIAFYQEQIAHYGNKKVMLPEVAMPSSVLLFAWPTAYETWIISTIQNKRTASLVYITDTSHYRQNLPNQKQFRGIRNYPYDSLKPPYFIWVDSLKGYQFH
ncbi:MAG: hypothetical protein FGM54_07795 [Chitinophagaceae bacterium]|nr:hypothetical protein [Chitinophagaceae bacterium]